MHLGGGIWPELFETTAICGYTSRLPAIALKTATYRSFPLLSNHVTNMRDGMKITVGQQSETLRAAHLTPTTITCSKSLKRHSDAQFEVQRVLLNMSMFTINNLND